MHTAIITGMKIGAMKMPAGIAMGTTETSASGKIAFFFLSLEIGGVQRIMLNLSKHLNGLGFPVDLVLIRASGPFMENVSDRVRVIDLQAVRAVRALPALVRYLRRERPAVLLSAQTHVNAVAVIARRFAGGSTRLVLSEHNCLCGSSRRAEKILDRMRPLIARYLYQDADGIVAVSRVMAKDLSRRAGISMDRIGVIHNSVSDEEVREKSGYPLRHPWFGHEKLPVVLAMGRLSPAKDYPTLLRAFSLVSARRDARLVILGAGTERPKLESLIAEMDLREAVSLPGFDTNPFPYMARCSVYVLSSAWEGFPNVPLEALACEANVVSTDCLSGPA
jgi:glycosyltransferase involved in cell wall biosynthesis